MPVVVKNQQIMTWTLRWCSFNCCDIDRHWGLIVDEVCLVSVSMLLSGCCSSPAALLFFEAHFLSFLSPPPSPHRHYHSQCSYWYVSAEGRRLQRQGLESKKPQTAAHGAPGNLRLNQPTDLTGTAETHWFWFFVLLSLFLFWTLQIEGDGVDERGALEV